MKEKAVDCVYRLFNWGGNEQLAGLTRKLVILHLWASGYDGVIYIVLLEVFDKLGNQALGLFVVGVLVRPGFARV